MAEDGFDEYEEWQLVGDAYFSRRELYRLDWGGGGGGSSGGGNAMDLSFMRWVPAVSMLPESFLRFKAVSQCAAVAAASLNASGAASNADRPTHPHMSCPTLGTTGWRCQPSHCTL
jgi:hypothetical protein